MVYFTCSKESIHGVVQSYICVVNNMENGNVHSCRESMNRRNKQFNFADKSISPHVCTRKRPVPTIALSFPVYTNTS